MHINRGARPEKTATKTETEPGTSLPMRAGGILVVVFVIAPIAYAAVMDNKG